MKIKTVQTTCPTCGARPGRECRSSRQPGANSYGGGWGGPPAMQRPHPARVQARREYNARVQARFATGNS